MTLSRKIGFFLLAALLFGCMQSILHAQSCGFRKGLFHPKRFRCVQYHGIPSCEKTCVTLPEQGEACVAHEPEEIPIKAMSVAKVADDSKTIGWIANSRHEIRQVYFIPGWLTNPPWYLKRFLGNPTQEIEGFLRRIYPGRNVKISPRLWDSFGRWKQSKENAEEFGKAFADFLIREHVGNPRNVKLEQVVLVGHSLGGRAVVHTLAKLGGKYQVHHAVVMGAAIDNDDELLKIVGMNSGTKNSGGTTGAVLSMENVNDQILLYAYGQQENTDALGAFGLSPKIKNPCLLGYSVYRAMAAGDPEKVLEEGDLQGLPEIETLDVMLEAAEESQKSSRTRLFRRGGEAQSIQTVEAIPSIDLGRLRNYVKAIWNAGTHDSRKYTRQLLERLENPD